MATCKTLEELRQVVDLRRVIELFTNTKLLRSRITCPFHDDRNPSFSIYHHGDHYRYKCHAASCGAAGDVLSFIKHKLGTSNISQVLEWIDTNKIELEVDGTFDIKALQVNIEKNQEIREFWERLVLLCKSALLTDEGLSAVNWLRGRGVFEAALPYIPVGYFKLSILEENGIRKSDLEAHEVRLNDLYYEGSIAFFYYATPTELSRIKLRVAQGIVGKRDPMNFIGNELGPRIGFYGLSMLGKKDLEDITLVEGELDVLVPQSMSWVDFNEPATIICQSGAAAVQEATLELLTNLGVRRLRVWPDNDAGGVGLVQKISEQVPPFGLRVSAQWPTDYRKDEDPADYYRRHGSLQNAAPFLMDQDDSLTIWLARRHVAEFRALASASQTDFQDLRNRFVEIASRAGLRGFLLDDYLSFVEQEFPALQKDVLLYEIQRTGVGKTQQTIGKLVFLARPDGYCILDINPKTEESQWVPITNFTIEFTDIVIYHDEGGVDATLPTVSAVIRKGVDVYNICFSSADFSRFDDFITTVRNCIPAGITYDPVFRKYFDSVIHGFNANPKTTEGYNLLGLAGKRYVMPQWIIEEGVVAPNTRFFVRPALNDKYVQMYDTPLCTDTAVLKRAAELIARKLPTVLVPECQYISLFLTGHIAASPIVEILDLHPGILYLEGIFDAGKSTLCQLHMNLASRYALGRGNVSFQSTGNYITRLLNQFSGLPVFIDDIKSNTLDKGTVKQFINILQGYHDRQGRGRLNKTLDIQGQSYIRGHLIACGQSLPVNEGSMLSRMIMLNIHKGAVDFGVINELKPELDNLSLLWPYYIAWLQRNADKIVLDESFALVSSGQLSRLSYFINYIGTGLKLYYQFLHEEFKVDRAILDTHLRTYRANALLTAGTNKTAQEEEAEYIIFIRGLEALAHSGAVSLTPNAAFSGKCVGFRQGNTVLVYPDLAVREVSTLMGMAFNKSTLLRQLRAAAVLDEDSPLRQVRWGPEKDSSGRTARTSLWAIQAKVLFANLGDPQFATTRDPVPSFDEIGKI